MPQLIYFKELDPQEWLCSGVISQVLLMVQMLGLIILEELQYLKTQLFLETYTSNTLLLQEPHAVEVHIPASWSHENAANGSLVSVPLWSREWFSWLSPWFTAVVNFSHLRMMQWDFSKTKQLQGCTRATSGTSIQLVIFGCSLFWSLELEFLMCCLNGIYLWIADLVQEASRTASVYLSWSPPE